MTHTQDKPNTAILKTKRHFELLDGLRGIAALCVVTFHFMEMAISDYSKNFIGHGFLAVDFFFCLSGFVIAYAYDDRIGTMGVLEFFKSRIIRLHPLVLLGSVLGLISFLFDPFGHPELYSHAKVALIFLASIFLIPYPVMQERGHNLFSLNAPAWSLFWEYIANIVYALVLCRLRRGALVVFTTLAVAVLAFMAFHAGNMMGGWGGRTFWDGGARVAYSFAAGMLVYRSNWIIPNKLGFAGLSILLLLAFFMPYFHWNWLVELLVVLLYFPFLVALGAGATLTPRTKQLCIFSGKMSYPLYMTHYSVIWIFASYYEKYKPGTAQLALIVSTGVVTMVGFAYLAMVLYDTPVRRFLSCHRKTA